MNQELKIAPEWIDRLIDGVGLIRGWDNLFFSDKIIERKSQLEIHPHSDRWKLPSANSLRQAHGES